MVGAGVICTVVETVVGIGLVEIGVGARVVVAVVDANTCNHL